jgi:hypothetical protein
MIDLQQFRSKRAAVAKAETAADNAPRYETDRRGRRIAVETLPMDDAKPKSKQKKFARVPLDDDWGCRAATVAERGAAIVLYAVYMQRTTGRGDVPITAALLRRWGINQKIRTRTINRLVAAGFATVKRRGKFRGCPLLTMNLPVGEG